VRPIHHGPIDSTTATLDAKYINNI